jgi:hypothetical protein
MQELLYHALPDNNRLPARFFQKDIVSGIAIHIGLYFIHPECRIGFRDDKILTAFMHVPETPVNEDTNFLMRKYDNRSSGKSVMNPVPESLREEQLPDQ